MDRKRRISRVDVQVSIVTAVLVTTPLICVYFFNYFITHEDMINSLKERSHSIYQYVDDYVDKTTFQNTEALTRDNPAYIRMKEKLEEVPGPLFSVSNWNSVRFHPEPSPGYR